jgi:hypothetical protein
VSVLPDFLILNSNCHDEDISPYANAIMLKCKKAIKAPA